MGKGSALVTALNPQNRERKAGDREVTDISNSQKKILKMEFEKNEKVSCY